MSAQRRFRDNHLLRGVCVKGDVERPIGVGVERNALKNRMAEQIASSADRLEQQAAEVRATDKQLALQLLREATRLRRVARGIDIQHKRAARARMRQKGAIDPVAKPDKSQAAWIAFLTERRDGDATKFG
jgi:hypothetical protein